MALNTRPKHDDKYHLPKVVCLPDSSFWRNYVHPTVTDINPALGPVRSPTLPRKFYEDRRRNDDLSAVDGDGD